MALSIPLLLGGDFTPSLFPLYLKSHCTCSYSQPPPAFSLTGKIDQEKTEDPAPQIPIMSICTYPLPLPPAVNARSILLSKATTPPHLPPLMHRIHPGLPTQCHGSTNSPSSLSPRASVCASLLDYCHELPHAVISSFFKRTLFLGPTSSYHLPSYFSCLLCSKTPSDFLHSAPPFLSIHSVFMPTRIRILPTPATTSYHPQCQHGGPSHHDISSSIVRKPPQISLFPSLPPLIIYSWKP